MELCGRWIFRCRTVRIYCTRTIPPRTVPRTCIYRPCTAGPAFCLKIGISRPFKIVWIVCELCVNWLILADRVFQAFPNKLPHKMRPCRHIVAALLPCLGPQTQHCKIQLFHNANNFLIQSNWQKSRKFKFNPILFWMLEKNVVRTFSLSDWIYIN